MGPSWTCCIEAEGLDDWLLVVCSRVDRTMAKKTYKSTASNLQTVTLTYLPNSCKPYIEKDSLIPQMELVILVIVRRGAPL